MIATSALSLSSRVGLGFLALAVWAPLAARAQETPPVSAPPPSNSTADAVSSVPLSGPIRKLDVLKVVVAGSDLGGLVRVEGDGSVSLPRLGKLVLVRRETADAAQVIATRIQDRKLLRDAEVAVYIVGRKPEEVSIYGAVGQPGRQALREDMLLSDAIETAGPQATADLSRVIITRRADADKTKAPDRTVATPQDLTVDYRQFRTGVSRDTGYNPPLRDGDRVFVYQLIPANAGTVRLTGQLKDPSKSVVGITQGQTAGQVLQDAGGVNNDADRSRIAVVRTDSDGKQTQIPVPYDDIVRGDRSKDVALQRGDEIVVPRAGRPQVVNVNGAVRDGNTFPYRAGITLQEAISLAGGPIDGAQQNKVEVRRQLPENGMKTYTYNLGKDKEAATVLQEGDTVFVPYGRHREAMSMGTMIGAMSGLAILFSQLRR